MMALRRLSFRPSSNISGALSTGVMVLAVGTRDGGPIRVGENAFATDATGARIVATLDVEGLEALANEAGAFVTGRDCR